MLRVDVVCFVGVAFNCLSFEGWIRPLIVMDMASLHDVHPVLVDQILKVKGQVGHICMLIGRGRVKGPMDPQYDPLDGWVVPGLAQVFLKVVVLLAVEVVGVLGGEVDDMHLSVVEGKP